MATDVAILGGGAAGLSAARETRRLGGRAVIVSNGPLGGDCTFTGCVPSKTVIEASLAGLSFDDAFGRARHVVERIASTESADRLRAEGVEVIEGEGRLVVDGGRGAIEVGERTVTARGVVVATGSRPLVPPIPGLAEVDHLTTDDLWQLTERPASLAVIGGGAIGCELSQALARLGVAVTLIELAPRLLSNEEPEASRLAAEALRLAGVDVRTGAAVTSVAAGPGSVAGPSGVVLQLDDGTTVAAERVLVAVGRSPNAGSAGLAEAGLELDDRGYVSNDDDLSTGLAGVYVAGDAAGRLQLTHAADHMGRVAVNNVLRARGPFRRQRFRADQIPWVTFTTPEIARIGVTEDQAAGGGGALVAELPLDEHDRALTADAVDGFIKIIAVPRPGLGMTGGGRIIGATIVAERAGEMLAEVALAVRLGAFTGRLAQTVHAYPTWSYGVAKTVGQFFTEVEGRTARPARRS
ncbi:MAG: NAD(P)/FAD-dependent oxidoreductase [Actinomycetota bacterium]